MNKNILLSRDAFREGVFNRSNGKCVCCDNKAVDAHHIIERRLWPDGGYYLDNGASVCEKHHILCEMTLISVEEIRDRAGIKNIIVPPHLYKDQVYDKWGNPVMSNGTRLRGELFYDESVQKILEKGQVLGLFTHWVKYPRTHHVPWSPGMNDDDRKMDSMSPFMDKRVIVTEKMDGENTTMYQDHFHARSVDSPNHPSRSWAKNIWGNICLDIPKHWRICAENLYAQHSIAYDNLDSYLMGFSVWDDKNNCLSWDESLEWFDLLNIKNVPVLYDGLYDEDKIKKLHTEKDWGTSEGYVVRIADSFPFADFKNSVAKFVRSGHVQTNKHWMRGQRVIPNGLKSSGQSLKM